MLRPQDHRDEADRTVTNLDIRSLAMGASAGFMLTLPAVADPDRQRALSVIVENDAIVDTDRFYSNGIRLEYAESLSGSGGLTGYVADTLLGADEGSTVLVNYALGHAIFTPEDISVSKPLPDQRPYAGFLFGDYAVFVRKGETISSLLVQVGLVGPSAGGEDIQNWYHSNIIDRAEAQGWDNQIGDELGFVLAYDRQFPRFFAAGDNKFGVDIGASAGAAIGTFHTDVHAGLTARLGSGLDLDYGPPRIKPSLAGSGYFDRGERLTGYLFAGTEVRAVAHDIFIDGSLFRSDDPSVEGEPVVVDFQLGGISQYKGVQLSVTYVYRTEEYTTQSDAQQFTAIGLATRF